MDGKSGTLSPEDFNTLSSLATTYGEKTLALKVAKVCTKAAAPLVHEFPNSVVAKAYNDTAKRITDALGTNSTSITGSDFANVSKMVSKYGPELVVIKLAKIAKKANKASVASSLRSIFPSS